MLLCLLCAGMMCTPIAFGAAPSHRLAVAAGPDDQTISGTVEDAEGPMVGATVAVAVSVSQALAGQK